MLVLDSGGISYLAARSQSEVLARRAALLRTAARRGSAVDALVIAAAEPGGTVLTGDPDDLSALTGYARAVRIVVASRRDPR